jgi:GNAT superfamily N-acetyltransferase
VIAAHTPPAKSCCARGEAKTSVERMIEVRRVTVGDWEDLRSVRLRALRDAPYAFGSTYAREAARGDKWWRDRTTARAWFLAWNDGLPVGIIAGEADPGTPAHQRHVVSMWVDPAARGTGAADALMAAVGEWARQQGASTLTLWVADASPRARAFYRRTGFRDTGVRQPLPSNPQTAEAELSLDLG